MDVPFKTYEDPKLLKRRESTVNRSVSDTDSYPGAWLSLMIFVLAALSANNSMPHGIGNALP
jgi:hypothetical protein